MTLDRSGMPVKNPVFTILSLVCLSINGILSASGRVTMVLKSQELHDFIALHIATLFGAIVATAVLGVAFSILALRRRERWKLVARAVIAFFLLEALIFGFSFSVFYFQT